MEEGADCYKTGIGGAWYRMAEAPDGTSVLRRPVNERRGLKVLSYQGCLSGLDCYRDT